MKKIYITLLAIAAIGASQVVLAGEQDDEEVVQSCTEAEKEQQVIVCQDDTRGVKACVEAKCPEAKIKE
jgi:acyl-coenzyme A synthetase/AMP-(fatty) acid ligase